MKAVVFLALVGSTFGVKDGALPGWLAQAGLGFLEGFMSEKSADTDMCIAGLMGGPIGDIKNGLDDIKLGLKDRNLTDIQEGIESLRQVMTDFPTAMKQCEAAEADLKAIVEVLKGFHGMHDIINHIKSDLDADSKGDIAQEFELMVRSFEEKKYDDFGRYLGQMLHRVVVGPEGVVRMWPSKCTGSADPSGSLPKCYEGKAGALGIYEIVNAKLLTYGNGKGTMDLTGKGVRSLDCKGKSFSKSSQKLIPDLGSCLPDGITIETVKYCSDDDSVYVTVKDSKIPFPISTTLKSVTCSSAEVLV